MKNLLLVLGFLFSLQSMASETTLVCVDQNGHAVYQLQLSEDLTISKLVTLVGDSSALSAGAKYLKIQEEESSPEMATYTGKSNALLHIALLFNSHQASSLRPFETLEVTAYYQQKKGDILSGKTDLLCSK
ncbi:MAG: hypothetical protein PHY93_17415 [Bacteriovorax sp.]|nr:hypothetical protein [Bacteriovorax sp.]